MKVVKERVSPMPVYTFAPTGQPIPWQWWGSTYGAWMVAYVLLWDATGHQADLAQLYAADFAKEIVSRFNIERWEISLKDVQGWMVAKCNADLTRPR